MLPTRADGTPSPSSRRSASKPHAWVKLWKHHAAQPEANRINEIARETGQAWLDRYGGKISSEWFFAKALQILDEAPEVYAAADRLIEAADWVVWQLTGVETRNACTAGYKAMWSKQRRLPGPPPSSRRSTPAFANVVDDKMSRDMLPAGDARRRAARSRPPAGPGCEPGPRSPSPTSTPTSPCRRRPSSSPAGWS